MSRTAASSLKLSVLTLGSRVLGLVRDHFQAVFFGTGPIATAWEIAYMLPNMLRNLLAEGVLAQAFIPVYSQSLSVSEEEARRAAGAVIGFLFAFLLVLVAVAILIFPFVLPSLSGMKAPADVALLLFLARVLFVFILTASLTALFAGISNAHLLFSFPALSPILLNLVFIAGFIGIGRAGLAGPDSARTLAFVVVAGGFVQLIVQMLYVAHKGLWPEIRLRLRHPALRKVFSLMAPAVIGASLFQLNQLADIAIAGAFLPLSLGAVPALRFAHRLVQLPTGVVGTALATAILPTLARQIREEANAGEVGRELHQALSFALFLTVPATAGLIFLGQPIIDLLFYGGAWDAASTSTTWMALRFYLLGVPFFSLNKILTSSFYAYQDTRTPVRVMLGVLTLNLTLNLILVRFLAHGGLALSTAISSGVTTLSLFWLLRRRIPTASLVELGRILLQQMPAYVAIALTLYAISLAPPAWFNQVAELLRMLADGRAVDLARYRGAAQVLLMLPPAALAYFATAALTRSPDFAVLRAFVSRRRR